MFRVLYLPVCFTMPRVIVNTERHWKVYTLCVLKLVDDNCRHIQMSRSIPFTAGIQLAGVYNGGGEDLSIIRVLVT